MLVCSRCKKNLNNEISANIVVVRPSTLPTNGHQDYSLCENCGQEYYKRLSIFEDEYILGKKKSPQIRTENDDTRVILIENNTSKESDDSNKCNHEWYPISCFLYEVEGCQGYICSKCGKLACYCSINRDREVIIYDRGMGDHYFHEFHENTPVKVDEITSE